MNIQGRCYANALSSECLALQYAAIPNSYRKSVIRLSYASCCLEAIEGPPTYQKHIFYLIIDGCFQAHNLDIIV